MYKKQKSYTLPVENREVIVPDELLPPYAKRCFEVMGEETDGIPTDGGILVAHSDKEEERVTIKYDYYEETDEVTPIVEAIKDIPQTIIPEADYSVITEALKNVEDAIYATEAEEQDVTPVIAALDGVKQAVQGIEMPEIADYTTQLDAIAKRIPESTDLSEIVDLLRSLDKESSPIEFPPDMVSDNRLKVEVDRIGGGGGFTTERVEAILNTGAAVKAADSPSVDAFGKWRVSQPETLFDSKQLYDSQPLFWDDQEVSGGGTSSTHYPNKACTTMAVSDSTAGLRVRQTFMHFNYQPGKGQRVLLTCGNMATSTGITKGIGYGNEKNGLFLANEEGTLKFIRRTYVTGSAVDNKVEVPKILPDGTTLDLTKTFILDIDFEWLGVGRVRAGYVQGVGIEYFFTFTGVNNLATVYMSTPNLPVRYWIENDGNGGADTFDHICCSVQSEGGLQKLGILRHADSNEISCSTAGTRYVVMAGRLKSTHFGLSVDLENVSALVPGTNDLGHWELIIGGTPSASLTFNGVTNSGVEIALGNGTITHSGGTEIDGSYVSTQQAAVFNTPNAARLGSAIDGTPQVFYLVFVPQVNNTDVVMSVTWRELL